MYRSMASPAYGSPFGVAPTQGDVSSTTSSPTSIPCNFNTDYINAVKTDEARQQGRTWLAQSHVLSGTCTDEDTGFAAAHTIHTHHHHHAWRTRSEDDEDDHTA